jgi:hypothetical protein
MKILSVLSGCTIAATTPDTDYAAAKHEPRPPGVTAVTFVITAADDSSDRFVAYAVDTGAGRVAYAVGGLRGRIPDLIKLMSATIELVSTGVLVGPLPPPPGGDDFPSLVAPGPNHPVVALAMIHHQVIASIERLA